MSLRNTSQERRLFCSLHPHPKLCKFFAISFDSANGGTVGLALCGATLAPILYFPERRRRLLSTLLAAIADFERDLIRERTGEGRKRAMAAGTKFGRPRKLSDYQRREAIKRRADGETLAAISKSYGVSIAMISRLETRRSCSATAPHRRYDMICQMLHEHAATLRAAFL